MAATKLVFTTQPDGAVTGVALTTQPVVKAVNAVGQVDATFSGNVTVAVYGGSGSLSGTAPVADFGDSGTSTKQNPTHQYSGAGTYTVALQATNADGSDIKTKTSYITVISSGGSSGGRKMMTGAG